MANPRKAPRPGKGSIKKSPAFRLTYLPANQRWVVLVEVEQGSFESKKEAVAVLKRRGLKVSAAGVISSTGRGGS